MPAKQVSAVALKYLHNFNLCIQTIPVYSSAKPIADWGYVQVLHSFILFPFLLQVQILRNTYFYSVKYVQIPILQCSCIKDICTSVIIGYMCPALLQ